MDRPATTHSDVLLLGGGTVAEALAPTLLAAGRSVAVVEMARVGGECAYVACIPSKVLLRAAGIRGLLPRLAELGAAASAVNGDDPSAAWQGAVRRRDEHSEQRDDAETARRMVDAGVRLHRGRGRVTAPGRVLVEAAAGTATLTCDHLVIATGSEAVRPDVEGLDVVPTWTSDEALSSPVLPPSLVILGGSAVGCELAQVYARFGVRVTVVESAPRLVAREPAAIGELLAAALEGSGVALRLGRTATGCRVGGDGALVDLDDGTTVEGARILLAAGRRPRTADIGLEVLGIRPGKGGGIDVDDRCRVTGADGVSAAGDVTAVAPYTHTAALQGRVIADRLLGGGLRVDAGAIPRAVYTDPPIASVGIGEDAARAQGIDVVVSTGSFDAVARPGLEGDDAGRVVLVADRSRGVLVGASLIGLDADALIGELVLAVGARIPVAALAAVVHPFPSAGEVLEEPMRKLARLLEGAATAAG